MPKRIYTRVIYLGNIKQQIPSGPYTRRLNDINIALCDLNARSSKLLHMIDELNNTRFTPTETKSTQTDDCPAGYVLHENWMSCRIYNGKIQGSQKPHTNGFIRL